MFLFSQKNPLLYKSLKIVVRLFMVIFCRRIYVNKPDILKTKGPLLLACNHPNSFLDGILLDILFDQPVYALARGDVFKKPFYARLLHRLKLLPVYRWTEGAENLGENYRTFEACTNIFRNKGIVQIFSEGQCINEWHLRPLKKGTARLSIISWEQQIPLQVMPVGINYSSFRKFGKNVFINFGDNISSHDIPLNESDGKRYQAFNDLLCGQLETLVFEIDKKDRGRQTALLQKRPTRFYEWILGLPAGIGYLSHLPLYLPVKNFVWKRCNHNDHYDSVLAAMLLFLYPIYLLLIISILWMLTRSIFSWTLLILLPFTAWSYIQLKPQLD